MSRVEPYRMHLNVFARLNSILNMIVVLEDDYQKRLSERPVSGDINYDIRLCKASDDIRALRLDAQRIALEAGEDVSVWWAERNKQVLQQNNTERGV